MKNFLATFLLFFSLASMGQNPVTWKATYKPISATEGEITIVGTLENGWHTYSQRATDAGPIPTTIKFSPLAQYDLNGKTEETGAHEEFVKAFDAKIFVFTGKAEFHQKIKVKGKGFTIPITIEYTTCNDMMCQPPKTITLQVKVG